MAWDLQEKDSRVKRFSDELVVVHYFINLYGKPFDFVYLLNSLNKY